MPSPAVDAASHPLSPPRDRGGALGWLLAVLLAAAFFNSLVPFLDQIEFFDGMEHITLCTVLEMHRDGHWLMPTLEGEPRIVKPPLTVWISALGVQAQTVRNLASPNTKIREAAYHAFVFQCRWPAVICSSVMLIFVFLLGRTLADWRVGIIAAAICAANLLVLREARRATADLQLSLWVTAANAFLAMAIFQGRRWIGWTGAGIAIGLAFMSKGPVSLLQTAVPFGVFVAWDQWDRRKAQFAEMRSISKSRTPIVVAILLALVFGLWWYVMVMCKTPHVLSIWFREVTRHNANEMKPDPWHRHAGFILLMRPWTAFFILGAWYGIRRLKPIGIARDRAAVLALFLWLVPILIMSCFHERQRRYLFPMAGAASVSAALAVARYTNGWRGKRGTRNDKAGGGDVVSVEHDSDKSANVYANEILPDALPIGGTSNASADAGSNASTEGHCVRPENHGRAAQATGDDRGDRTAPSCGLPECIAAWAHWIFLASWAVGLPLMVAFTAWGNYRTIDNARWYSHSFGLMAASVGGIIVLAGILASRRWRGALVVSTIIAMWFSHEIYLQGVRKGDDDLRPMETLAENIWMRYPTAEIYATASPTEYGKLSMPMIVLSLRVDRTIRAVGNAGTVLPTGRPQLLLVARDDPAPPRGWFLWWTNPRANGPRSVYVREMPGSGAGRAALK